MHSVFYNATLAFVYPDSRVSFRSLPSLPAWPGDAGVNALGLKPMVVGSSPTRRKQNNSKSVSFINYLDWHFMCQCIYIFIHKDRDTTLLWNWLWVVCRVFFNDILSNNEARQIWRQGKSVHGWTLVSSGAGPSLEARRSIRVKIRV